MLSQVVRICASFGGFQIEDGAFLPPIPGYPCRVIAERIAGRRLDLNYISTEISQDSGSKSTCHPPTEVQNHESIARSGHYLKSSRYDPWDKRPCLSRCASVRARATFAQVLSAHCI